MANPGPASTSTTTFVGGGAPFSVADSTADVVSFYGATGTSQLAGGAQTALSRGLAFGQIATFAATTQAAYPVITGQTTSSQIITAITTSGLVGASWQIATTDLVYVNKPTSQAGLGISSARVSAANVIGVQFSNYGSAASVTPTAGEKYGIVAIRGLPSTAITLSPATVSAATTVEQQFTVTGLRAGELVQVIKPTQQTTLDIIGCRVVSNNLLGITFANLSPTTPVTPTASESYTVWSLGGLDATSNMVNVTVPVPALAVVAITTLFSEQALTMTGLATSDVVVGVSKPTSQSVGIVGARVSAANSLAVTYMSGILSVTPTAGESYQVTIARPNPAAPLINYSVAVTPTAVAANTTAEQAFTVTGVIASSIAWVNKPSFTAGLGIVGCRVSGTNSIAVNYCNNTSASITPPAETYLFGNFQQVVPDLNAVWAYSCSPAGQANTVLTNAIRSALVTLGVIVGS